MGSKYEVFKSLSLDASMLDDTGDEVAMGEQFKSVFGRSAHTTGDSILNISTRQRNISHKLALTHGTRTHLSQEQVQNLPVSRYPISQLILYGVPAGWQILNLFLWQIFYCPMCNLIQYKNQLEP